MARTKGDDESEQRVIDDVQKHGWHVVGIEDDPDGPGFVYSIGIYHTLGQPEIIIFGLNSVKTMAQIINGIGAEMRKGTVFRDGTESSDVFEGYPCTFLPVPKSAYREYLGFAMWFYHPDDFPVLQCVWPDKQGQYPAILR